jgi:hypothetical protein
VLVTGQRPAPAEGPEEGRVANLGGGHVERAHLALELLGIVDEREQVRERDQLAIVEPPAHEARVVVAPLLAVRDDVGTRPDLRVDGQADCVVRGRLELRLAQPAFEVLVDRLEHPARTRPAPDAHHGQRADGLCRGRLRKVRGDGDGHCLARHGRERHRAQAPQGPALGQGALADEKAALLAPPDERHELVAGHPTPGREVLVDRNLGGTKFEEPAALQRVHVLPDQEKEPVATVQISAVEAHVGFVLVTVNGLHREASS